MRPIVESEFLSLWQKIQRDNPRLPEHHTCEMARHALKQKYSQYGHIPTIGWFENELSTIPKFY